MFLLSHSLSSSFKDSCSHKSLATLTLASKGLENRDHCRIPCFKAEPIFTIDISIHLCRVIGNPLSLVFPSLQGAMLKRANPWCEKIGEFSARPMVPGIELKLSICRWLSVGAPSTRRHCVFRWCFVYLKFCQWHFSLIFFNGKSQIMPKRSQKDKNTKHVFLCRVLVFYWISKAFSRKIKILKLCKKRLCSTLW